MRRPALRRTFAAAAAVLLAAVPVVAAEPWPQMLPPEVAKQFHGSHFDGMEEPPLWQRRALSGYRSRIRLSISGILRRKVSIRIDERSSGRFVGRLVFVEEDGRARPSDRTARPFPVTRAQMERLREAIRAAELWAIYPQFWVFTDPEALCIDGMELVFERADAQGYRFATANAQCTAPPALIRAAEMMIDIARADQVRNWLH